MIARSGLLHTCISFDYNIQLAELQINGPVDECASRLLYVRAVQPTE
jgi:hypothetical protein